MDATTKALLERTRQRKQPIPIPKEFSQKKNNPESNQVEKDIIAPVLQEPNQMTNTNNIVVDSQNKPENVLMTPECSEKVSKEHSTPVNEPQPDNNWDISIIPKIQTELPKPANKIYPAIENDNNNFKNSTLKRVVDNKENIIPRKSPRKSSSSLEPKIRKKCLLHDSEYCSDTIKQLLVQAAEQQNIVLQTSQALNICYSYSEDRRSLPETIEGERLLLLASKKKEFAMDKVSSLKENKSNCSCFTPTTSVNSFKAQLKISDIFIGIKNSFLNNLHESISEYGKCHFVALININDLFMSTQSVSILDIDQTAKVLKIPGTIDLGKIDSDFNATIVIYALQVKNSINPDTPRTKVWKKIATKHESSPLKSNSSVFRSSSFFPVGQCVITNEFITQTYFKLTQLSSNVPLDGKLLMKIECSPLFDCKAAGFLNIMDNDTSFWNRYWCVLDEKRLSYWAYPDDEALKAPKGFFEINWVFDEKVSTVNRSVCARPHIFQLVLRKSSAISSPTFKLFLAGDCREEKNIWMNTFSEHLDFHKRWFNRVHSNQMNIDSNKNSYENV